jgi:TetR/AcrR family transcriptional regulator, transcriptional repressor for nem operon
MPHPSDRKHRTRRQILEAAAKLFDERGFEATTIDDVMLACRLTRGGFYSHFRSKRHLYREAVKAADRSTQVEGAVTRDSSDWLTHLFDGSKGRLDDVEQLIPAWANRLATEVGSTTLEVREGYSNALGVLHSQFRNDMGDVPQADEFALAATAMMVGTLAIASSIDDQNTKTRFSEACRTIVNSMRSGENLSSAPHLFLRTVDYLWEGDYKDDVGRETHRLAHSVTAQAPAR